MTARTVAGVSGAAAALGMAVLAGCSSPLQDKVDRDLRRSVRESAQRELVEASEQPEPQRLTREDRVGGLGIKPEVMEQLSTMGGIESYSGKELPLGPNLYGKPQRVVKLTLERAIGSAVRNNLNVEFARLAPAISQQQLIAAEAAFDWVIFANPQASITNQPTTQQLVGGVPTGTDENRRDVYEATAGVRRPLIAGGQLQVQTELSYTDIRSRNLQLRPDPARETNVVVQLDQPLLRGFGSDVALANVRLARNAELDSIQQLKGTLLNTVGDVETAYWNLVRAQADVLILQRLLERGEEVFRVLKSRERFDAKPASISNAAATVELRRSDVIRAQRAIRAASDQLKTLMNDPELPVGSETLLLPADGPLDQPVEFSLVDAVNSAMASRPEVQRAVISMDNTSIRQVSADNARLPRLDLRALTRLNGQDDGFGGAYSDLAEAEYVDYQVALNFEAPLGNRGPEAVFRQRRLERMQATIAYRNTIQGIVNEVKGALRDLQTNYVLIEQTRAARIAAAEDLRTILVEEQTIQTQTPEFLNLKLQRQQALASAEQQEVQALVEYNNAVARLYQATGTGLERNRIQFDAPAVRQDRRTDDLFPDYPLEPRQPGADAIRAR
jgi:outer membrane protein TolC